MAVERGAIPILVGTHALLEKGVRFAKLGLAVVDEQHRFGVAQRAALTGKGENPDVLVMSATPIPRSLAMTLYGDLDLSVLDSLPAGRKPVVTRLTEESKRGAVLDFAAERIREGRQVYVVLPLVEASLESDLLAAREMADSFRKMPRFEGIPIGLLHGRMRPKEKERTMRDFAEGRIPLLVATTVVEVGVDVPNATMMILEHPERYGLSQLHQLRGRVGRGAHRSYCVLVAGSDLPSRTRERLQVLETTHDGFAIAEADLRFRGPGEILGVRQHGLPELKVADLVRDRDVLEETERAVEAILAEDPELRSPKDAALRARVEGALERSLTLLSSG
jgi:ATP-dependent DNA helicase RecG